MSQQELSYEGKVQSGVEFIRRHALKKAVQKSMVKDNYYPIGLGSDGKNIGKVEVHLKNLEQNFLNDILKRLISDIAERKEDHAPEDRHWLIAFTLQCMRHVPNEVKKSYQAVMQLLDLAKEIHIVEMEGQNLRINIDNRIIIYNTAYASLKYQNDEDKKKLVRKFKEQAFDFLEEPTIHANPNGYVALRFLQENLSDDEILAHQEKFEAVYLRYIKEESERLLCSEKPIDTLTKKFISLNKDLPHLLADETEGGMPILGAGYYHNLFPRLVPGGDVLSPVVIPESTKKLFPKNHLDFRVPAVA